MSFVFMAHTALHSFNEFIITVKSDALNGRGNLTWRDMSEMFTSSQLHLPNNLISGSSGIMVAGALATAALSTSSSQFSDMATARSGGEVGN